MPALALAAGAAAVVAGALAAAPSPAPPPPLPSLPTSLCDGCGIDIPPAHTAVIVAAGAAIVLDAAGVLLAGTVALVRRRR